MLIETSLLYVVLAVSSAKYEEGEGSVCVSSDKNHVILSTSKSANEVIPTDLVTAIGCDLATVPEVRHVMVEHAEGNLLVWISADSPNAKVREEIFKKQFAIINGFPEITFDFNLISNSRSARETSSSARLIYTRGV